MIYTCTFNPAIDYKMNTDKVSLGDLNRVSDCQFTAGGKGINVSMVLQHLNTPSIALGFIGGFTGQYVKEYLESRLAIETDFTMVSENTRLNVKVKETNRETEINALGPKVTELEMDDLVSKVKTFDKSDILVIGGSVARGNAETYHRLLEACKKENIDFIIDTSKDQLMKSLPYNPLLVKPNIFELEEIFNTTINSIEEVIEYGSKLVQQGAKNVIVSMGKDGSILINKSHIYQASPIIGNVVNTVGAGDSMVAGFVKGFVQGKPLMDCYTYAVACGTGTAFSQGLVDETMFNTYVEKVEIKVKK
jgi:1-phosphofructokinase